MRACLWIVGVIAAFGVGVGGGTQETARKAYLVVQVEVTNPTRYQEYAKLSPAIVAQFGGRFLARAGRSQTFEGPPAPSRVVVIEFPSFERAQAFYHSPEYVAARRVREGAGNAQFVVVEGLE